MALNFLNNGYFAGKVGIGTESPETKLDVRGQLLVAGDTPVARIGSTLEVYRNGTTAELSIHQDDSTVSSSLFSQLRFRNGGNDTYFKVPQSGNGLIIDVEGKTNAFVIDIDGNVGIGTTSPDAKLSISDILGISGTGNNTYGQIDLVNTQTGASGDEIGPFITFRGKRGGVDSVVAAYGAIGGVNTGTTGNSTGAITFLTKNAMGAAQDLVEQMRISTGGNVGIGTTSPNRSLHVIGQVAIDNSTSPSGGLLVSPDGTSNKVYSRTGNATSSAHPLDFISGSSTSMRIATNGNVGIGETAPDRRLVLDGTLGTAALEIKKETDRLVYLGTGSSAAGDDNTILHLMDQNVVKINLNTVGDSYLNGGNVGIGTTGPVNKIQANYSPVAIASLTASAGTASTNWNRNAFLMGTGASVSNALAFGVSGTANDRKAWIQSGHPDSAANSLGTISLNPLGGNVGIGITNPNTKLHVGGIIQVTDNGSNTAFYGGNYVRMFSDQNYGFRNSGGTYIANISMSGNSYFNGGNVGIGTTSPQSKLTVSGGEPNLDDTSNSIRIERHTSAAASPDVIGNGIVFAQKWWSGSAGLRATGGIYGIKDGSNGTYGGGLAFYTQPQASADMSQKMRITSTGGISFGSTGTAYGTSGQVLTSAGNASPTWTTPTTGTVTGTGVTGEVAYWTSSTNIANNAGMSFSNEQLQLDGIGGADGFALPYDQNPGYSNMSAGGFGILFREARDNYITGNAYWYKTGGTASWRAKYGADAATMIGSDGGNITFETAPANTTAPHTLTFSPRMVIKEGGNVGIGVTSPNAKLHIAGGSAGMFLSNLGDNSAYDSIKMSYGGYNSGTPEFIFTQTSTPGSGIANTWYRFKNTNGVEGTNPNNVANVTIGGKLGVGTDTPGESLEILKDGGAIIKLHDPGNNSWKIKADSNFHIYDDSNSDYLTILNSGNVGIGVTGPGSKLEVTGDIPKTVSISQTRTDTSTTLATMRSFYAFGITQFRGGVTRGLYMSNVTDNLPGIQVVDSSDNSGPLSIQPFGGNVGIGTTAPETLLKVMDYGTSLGITTDTGLLIGGTGSSGQISQIGFGYTENTRIPAAIGAIVTSAAGATKSDLIFATRNSTVNTVAPTERMRISSAGAIKFNSYDSTNNTGTPTYLLGTDASGNVVKTLTTPSPVTSQAASLYDLIPNGAFTTTYAFTSTAGTYSEVMSGDDVITANGTYSVQMLVNDFAVGGTQYDVKYSGVMTWHKTSTNDSGIGASSEIVLHRAGHASNQGITYLRTRETTSADNNELKLEIMGNKTYTSASNVIFKFVRLI